MEEWIRKEFYRPSLDSKLYYSLRANDITVNTVFKILLITREQKYVKHCYDNVNNEIYVHITLNLNCLIKQFPSHVIKN